MADEKEHVYLIETEHAAKIPDIPTEPSVYCEGMVVPEDPDQC